MDVLVHRWQTARDQPDFTVGTRALNAALSIERRRKGQARNFIAHVFFEMMALGFRDHPSYEDTVNQLSADDFSPDVLEQIYRSGQQKPSNLPSNTAVSTWIQRNLETETDLNAVVLDSLRTQPDSWFLDPICPGDWRSPTPEDDGFLRAAGTLPVVNRFDTILGSRLFEPSFYQDVTLVEVLGSIGDQMRIASIVVTPRECFVWNGTSASVHELNKKQPIALNEGNIVDYFRFFGLLVNGEEGPFRIFQKADEIPLFDQLPEKVQMIINASAKPVQISGRTEKGEWKLEAMVRYSNAIFSASFVVQPTGMIEMPQDEPIAADLPVPKEGFDNELRFLEPVPANSSSASLEPSSDVKNGASS